MVENGARTSDAPPSASDVEALAAEVYASLPGAFRARTADVVIQVAEFPDAETMRELGAENEFELLGLYRGVSLDQRSVLDAPSDVEIIFLYRRPILDFWCESEESLAAIVRNVLVHEIGHHFGLSDADMESFEDAATTETDTP